MNYPDGRILSSLGDKLGEKVTIKLYDVAYGMANYCLLKGENSGRKFTAMFREEPAQIAVEDNSTGKYTQENYFVLEKENIRILSEKGIAVPEIILAGDNFVIMPYLGENQPLDDSIMSENSRLDIAVPKIIDYFASLHSLPIDTIPHRASCRCDNLEFAENFNFQNGIGNSDYTLAAIIKKSDNYDKLFRLINGLSGIKVEECITQGNTYNSESVFGDGNKLHLTDYSFTGRGNPFIDIVCPVSWGLPSDTDAAVSKKQERIRSYLKARKINDEQGTFFMFDYFTILWSLNIMDVLLDINKDIKHEKAKILYKLAHRNIGSLISSDTDLSEARNILLSLIPEL
jgi:hypothetical protein